MKRLLGYLKNPGRAVTIAVFATAPCFVSAAIVCAALGYAGPVSYVAYALAAVTGGYAVYLLVRGLPAAKAAVKSRAKKHPLTDGILNDYGFRTVAFAVASFALNIAYAVFNGVLGIVSLSVWYGALAAYYVFLSAIRCGALLRWQNAKKRCGGAPPEAERWKIYRMCGLLLILLELALTAAVTEMVLSENPSAHTEITAIASAAYAFWKITLAIYNMIKTRRLRDPLLQSFRNINLTDALVSLLALQTTMTAVFSDGTDASMRALNAVTGFTVCAVTVGMGVWMIVRTNGQLKKPAESKQSKEATDCERP